VTQSPPLKVLQFSGPAYALGIEEHSIAGVQVKIYSAAKTVADCFKFRNQIGVTVAVAALRDAWRIRKATADDLYRAATACRVWNVMKPYVESVMS
jgi:predicted transcriptional regulator of viral defense system